MPPSLARELIQAILLKPDLVRFDGPTASSRRHAGGNALAALVDACSATAGPDTTAAVIEHFAGSMHAPVLAAALATATDQGVTAEHAEERLEMAPPAGGSGRVGPDAAATTEGAPCRPRRRNGFASSNGYEAPCRTASGPDRPAVSDQ